MRFAIVIMAAGKGTRLKSKRAKVLHQIGGKSLLEHVIHSATQIVPPQDVYVVVGHQAGAVQAAVASTNVHFVTQADQRGTGHAVQTARQAVAGYEHIIVLSGDVPLLQPETIARLRDFHLTERAAMTILTASPDNPHGYGRVIRHSPSSAEVTAIVEQKALTPKQESIREINSGIYVFASKPLFQLINELRTDNAHGEYYLTDMARVLVQEHERVVAIEAGDATEVLGANTLAEMAELDAAIRMATARRLMAQGVTIYRPETTVIDANVEVGADTIIEPYVQLLGETHIGEDCRIRSYSVIENSTLASHVLVRHGCIISESHVQAGALLGPYAHLRTGSEIGEEAHIGNFVETKKIRIGKGSKANHLSYLGDAEIGSGVNIGAGTITCNYNGVDKSRTLIENDVFVGSDTTLVAPIVIGQGSYIGAGSCIVEDVPPEALALGRAKQVTKDGWARSRRVQARTAREAGKGQS
ncbi:bifunctional UDP-N-acetylglucosamine diphosphorylase/glucosamine-1-phosphate N-acetyltransferase GlmU [Alloacidobacterium sp.]|uniref:bifunctional UDP-N-acetylglucosamine diphosphorylase/glucosamine-1-phosphate N-acetyltransferase GlmU n=1 Tax=Alloacidobacterium sp. TaxID=2951999 RepID=UPI002D717205|nr:bifunctional UDP-N-acetylglucosamine diphosphorylase/glucosamine-1-phosphate N-acetyltransferase GlmU [Alloacidobacterium sp.]HYK37667.1 bifunctional UDP-N-acetylglucosamine diphosphorylase/glucosamine-1-phosphate N-acetyltransferase GlmU [Alloacidobacterium sp.]